MTHQSRARLESDVWTADSWIHRVGVRSGAKANWRAHDSMLSETRQSEPCCDDPG
jgi:hypothetical protein